MGAPDFKARLAAARKRIEQEAGNVKSTVGAELPVMPEIKLDQVVDAVTPKPKPPASDWSEAPHEMGIVDKLKKLIADPVVKNTPGAIEQLTGLLHVANQVVTLGRADEIAGISGYLWDKAREAVGQPTNDPNAGPLQKAGDAIQGAVGSPPTDRTLEDYTSANRNVAEGHVGKASTPVKIAGGILGAAPAAAATAGLSIPAQMLTNVALSHAQHMGQGEGSELERAHQAQNEMLAHPWLEGANYIAPGVVGPAAKAAGKFADWFGDKRLNQLGNLITSAGDRAKWKAAEGTDAVKELARDAEGVGLFKGDNWFTDFFGVPTAGRVVRNAEKTIKRSGADIDQLTEEILAKAEARPDKNQQVDYGKVVQELEDLKASYRSDTDAKLPAKLKAIDKQIEAVKAKAASRYSGVKPEPVANASFEPEKPLWSREEEPIDVESEEIHRPTRDAAPPVEAENVSPQDVPNYEVRPEELTRGQSRNDAPAAMRFPNKALPASTTEPTPDELFSSPKGPTDRDAPVITEQERKMYEQAAAQDRKLPVVRNKPGEPEAMSRYEPAVDAEPYTPYEPGTDIETRQPDVSDPDLGTNTRKPFTEYEPPAESGDRTRVPPAPTGASPVQDAEYSEQYNWTPPPKMLERGSAPESSVSLREGIEAKRLAAKDVDFDPQVKPPTAVQKKINKARYVGHAQAVDETMGNLAREDTSFQDPVIKLRDANHDYHVAKEVQYPASLVEERNTQHAITPRELTYGLLSGHGQQVLAARFGRPAVVGTMAKALGVPEKAGIAAEKALNVVDEQGIARTAGQRNTATRSNEPRTTDDRSISDRLMGLGSSAYDSLFGATPRETPAERNERMSQTIRKRLEEQE